MSHLAAYWSCYFVTTWKYLNYLKPSHKTILPLYRWTVLTLSTSSANSNKSITLVSYSTTKSKLLSLQLVAPLFGFFFSKSLKWGYFFELDWTAYALCIALDYFPSPHPPHLRLEKILIPLTVTVTVRGIRREPFFQKRMLDSSFRILRLSLMPSLLRPPPPKSPKQEDLKRLQFRCRKGQVPWNCL